MFEKWAIRNTVTGTYIYSDTKPFSIKTFEHRAFAFAYIDKHHLNGDIYVVVSVKLKRRHKL